VQLSARTPAPPPAEDLAGALRGAAGLLGHRPAVTVLRHDRRDEQGFASLLQWASKTAHWLGIEHGLAAGDRLALVGPPGWVPVAACLGAWWAGVAVATDAGDAEVVLAHEHGDAASLGDAEVVSWGAAVDGSPVGASPHEPYAIAVQAFPDQPPAPAGAPDRPALVAGGRSWTHADLLAAARDLPDGRLGLAGVDVSPAVWVPALAVHPLTSGRPTVLLDGVDRGAAAGEKVDSWLPPSDEPGPRP
jgi:uncharacterized protein (TIGR03089 family)